MLATRMPPSNSSWLRSRAHSCCGGVFASQSTTCPRALNNQASNAPKMAVSSTIASMYRRMPREHIHMKRRKFRGSTGTSAGNGFTQRSKIENMTCSGRGQSRGTRRAAQGSAMHRDASVQLVVTTDEKRPGPGRSQSAPVITGYGGRFSGSVLHWRAPVGSDGLV